MCLPPGSSISHASAAFLTLWLRLSVEVVKELCVTGEHAAARGAGHHLLLGVASQVFPQAVLDLKEGIATCNRQGRTPELIIRSPRAQHSNRTPELNTRAGPKAQH